MRQAVEYSDHLRHGSGMSDASRKVPAVLNLQGIMEAVSREDDRDAYVQLFSIVAPKVKALMCQGGASDSLADDLTQDVMLKVWTRRKQYDPQKAAVSTWIYAIARNVRIDQFRKESRVQIDENDPALRPDDRTSPDESVDHAMQAERLKQAIAGLPEEQQEVLHLSYMVGLSHQEIAAKTDTPAGTVKSRIRLATGKLRLDLKEYI